MRGRLETKNVELRSFPGQPCVKASAVKTHKNHFCKSLIANVRQGSSSPVKPGQGHILPNFRFWWGERPREPAPRHGTPACFGSLHLLSTALECLKKYCSHPERGFLGSGEASAKEQVPNDPVTEAKRSRHLKKT